MNTRTTKRVVRRPLHRRGPQSISGDLDKDFVYRFVNDTGSRVRNLQAAGYEIVADDGITVGDARVSDASDVGSGKRVISNNGDTAYLMRIRKEFYKEDQEAKAQAINEQEAAMHAQSKRDTDYGSLKITKD